MEEKGVCLACTSGHSPSLRAIRSEIQAWTWSRSHGGILLAEWSNSCSTSIIQPETTYPPQKWYLPQWAEVLNINGHFTQSLTEVPTEQPKTLTTLRLLFHETLGSAGHWVTVITFSDCNKALRWCSLLVLDQLIQNYEVTDFSVSPLKVITRVC